MRQAGGGSYSDGQPAGEEAANRFLEETGLPKTNEKFSRPAADPADARVPPGQADLREIMCFEHERTVANDYVVRFECRLFQILKTNKVLLWIGDKVTVRVRLEGSLSILWKGKPLLNENRGDTYTKKSRPDSCAA